MHTSAIYTSDADTMTYEKHTVNIIDFIRQDYGPNNLYNEH